MIIYYKLNFADYYSNVWFSCVNEEHTQAICMLQSTDFIADAIIVWSGVAESQIIPIVTTSGEDFSDRFIRAMWPGLDFCHNSNNTTLIWHSVPKISSEQSQVIWLQFFKSPETFHSVHETESLW